MYLIKHKSFCLNTSQPSLCHSFHLNLQDFSDTLSLVSSLTTCLATTDEQVYDGLNMPLCSLLQQGLIICSLSDLP